MTPDGRAPEVTDVDPESQPDLERRQQDAHGANDGQISPRITDPATRAAPAHGEMASVAKPGLERQARGAARVLRRRRTGQGDRPRVPRQRGDRDHRTVRLRQVDDGALHQPHARGDPRRARRGQCAARRTSTCTTHRLTSWRCDGRSGWSSRSPTRFRRCRSSTTSRPGLRLSGRRRGDVRARRSRRRCAARDCGMRSPTASTSREPVYPAASSSGCASRARWRSSPR